MMKSLYLVRHGQASFGASDYDQLSDLGMQQCAMLGQWLGKIQPVLPRLLSGSQRRHQQSGAACLWTWCQSGSPAASPISVDTRLDEFDHSEVLLRALPQFADMQALSTHVAQLKNPARGFQDMFSSAAARWVSGKFDSEYRESWPEFKSRCQSALREACARLDERQSMLMFTSSGVISAVCQGLLGVPDDRIFDLNWSLVNSGITRLLFHGERLTLGYLNSFAHLESAKENLVSYR